MTGHKGPGRDYKKDGARLPEFVFGNLLAAQLTISKMGTSVIVKYGSFPALRIFEESDVVQLPKLNAIPLGRQSVLAGAQSRALFRNPLSRS